jgi:Flp pilus assembly protein TadG
MPRSSLDLSRPFQTHLREALCRQMRMADTPGPEDTTVPSWEGRPGKRTRCDGHEQGSAVVEFTFLALLLMVPVVYFIITVGQIQGGSFAVVGAADQAAKVYVAQADASSAQAAAEQAAAIALADFGHRPEEASVAMSCNPADCQAPGTAVTVTVSLTVPLPFVPFNNDFRLNATEVEASATQLVGRFR